MPRSFPLRSSHGIVVLRQVTALERNAFASSTSHEVQFWMSMEKALADVRQQLDSPEVEITLSVLKQAKR